MEVTVFADVISCHALRFTLLHFLHAIFPVELEYAFVMDLKIFNVTQGYTGHTVQDHNGYLLPVNQVQM